MLKITTAFLLLVLIQSNGKSQTKIQNYYIDSLLKQRKDFYKLKESEFDSFNLSFVKEEYKSHPYFVSSDFNKDGLKDFALLLGNNQKEKGDRCLVVFNGVGNAGYYLCQLQYEDEVSPFFYEQNINNSMFVAYRNFLFVAAAETDIVYEFIPTKNGYKLKGESNIKSSNNSGQLKEKTIEIPIDVRKEFAKYANYTFVKQKTSFTSLIITHYARLGVNIADTYVLMESLAQRPKDFDEVLKAIWNQSSQDKEYLLMQFLSFGASAKTANILTEYTLEKFMK